MKMLPTNIAPFFYEKEKSERERERYAIKSIGACRPLSSSVKTNFSSGQFVYDPVTCTDSNMSVEPFNRLVKLAARAFYDDALPKGDNQQKTGRSDNKGIAVVILDALTRRQWVREEDLAKDLKLHTKQLRRTLRFFEEEKLITRDHRKETAKGAKIHNYTVAATGDGYHNGREDEKIKMHTHSYCCLDYAQTYDVIRYRLHRMKKKLKDELDDKDKVQEYICPNCQRRYTALDAGRLVSMDDYDFHCEACNGVLVPESEKLPVQDVGDADENARRRNRNLLQDMLHKMEVQLKPLNDQLNLVKDLGAPEFGTLQAWETRANALRVNGDPSSDPNTSHGFGIGGSPMPYIGETKVEVAIFGTDGKGDVKSENGTAPMKVLPPWMIKTGMVITDEQRGEVKGESKMDVYSTTAADSFEEKKSVTGLEEEEKNVQDEYLKAYYAAFYKRQSEQEEAAKNEQDTLDPETKGPSLAERQVGEKSKREDDNDGADVVWEEAPAGNTSKHYKVNDLNMEAGGSGDEEEEGDDEDIWEEG